MNNSRLVTVIPTPLERRVGRLLRSPEGHGQQGGSQDSGDNNSGGNGDGSGTESSGRDNRGQGFNYETFWDESGDSETGSPRGGESAESETGSSGSPNQNKESKQQQSNPAQAIREQLESLNVGNVMTDQVIADLGEGKADSFHQNLNIALRNISQQNLQMTLGIMAQVRDDMMSRMEAKMNGTLQNRDNLSDLHRAIPSAKDPKVAAQVESIFNRALKISKGDRQAAIGMTKDMLRLQTETLGGDIGLPPRGRGDNFGGSPETNWLEELAIR